MPVCDNQYAEGLKPRIIHTVIKVTSMQKSDLGNLVADNLL